MPTKAHPDILNRDLARAAARPAADSCSNLLREIINNATMVLVRCEGSGCGEESVDLAAFYLYRHMIEMTDGIDELVLESVIVPAMTLLRSSFEAGLALEYILEDSRHYKERALSWIAYYAIQRRETLEQFDPTTPEGERFEADRRADIHAGGVRDWDQKKAAFDIANLDELLAKDYLRPFKDAYDALRGDKKRRRRVMWSELHRGPRTLYALAKHLRHQFQFRLFYNQWSSVGHAQDVTHLFVPVAEDRGALRPLRQPTELLNVTRSAATYLVESTKRMLEHFRPGEDSYPRWYTENVRAQFLALMGRAQSET